MGGTKTKTFTDLQVQKLMDEPEKAYKASMRQAYKNINVGMRSVMREYQQGMVDTRALFNDGYLTSLGYNPKEDIVYKVVDPILVLEWLRNNIDSSISSVVQYKWGIPTLEEIALEYLQDSYIGMDLVTKSFIIDSVRWYVSGVTNVSSFATNATCYKDRVVTADEYAYNSGLVVDSIADDIFTKNGVNYWQVTMTNGSVVNVPIVYTTIECPGVGSDVVHDIVTEYNGKEYAVSSSETIDDVPLWTNTVKISAYVDTDGNVKISGRAMYPTYEGRFNSAMYLEATKQAVSNIIESVQKEIDLELLDSLDKLIVTYNIGGVNKLKLAEISSELVSNNAQASAYPIIPLRENYGFVKETREMKAMLNKLGMATDDFEVSLNNSQIKNAAIMFILDLKDESEVGTKVVYETLHKMVQTTIPASGKVASYETYQLDLGFSDVNMKTNINLSMRTVSGSIGAVGSYHRYSRQVEYTVTEESGGADQSWSTIVTKIGSIYGIRKQVTSSYYEEMEFTSGKTNWQVGGYSLGGAIGLGVVGNEEVYIPITDLGLSVLTYEELHYAIASSMSIVMLSVVTVKIKWHQSGFFKFVMWAVAMAIFVITGNPMALLMMVANEAGLFNSKLGKVLQVAMIIYGGYSGVTSAGVSTGEAVLTSAATLVQLVELASQINLDGALKAIENKRKATQSELESSEKQLEEIAESTQQGLWMGIQDRDPELLYAMSSTAMMCNYDVLYDYDGLFDKRITSVGI